MKKTLLAVALAAATSTAYADVKLSGHVNYVYGDVEDFNGEQDAYINGANTTMSRFRMVAETEAGDITYGSKIEVGLSNSSQGNGTLFTRVNEAYAKGAFGKLTLGQGSEAGDGVAEADFSGTYVLTGASYESWGLNNLIRQIDGSRDQRLRYDSPKLAEVVTLSVSQSDSDDIQAAIQAGFKAGDADLQFGVYNESVDDDDANNDSVGYSVAGKLAGFTLAYQGGEVDDSYDFNRIILGYVTGPYSVAVDYSTTDYDDAFMGDVTDVFVFGGEEVSSELLSGEELETTGLSFVYRPTKGVELYAGYREVEVKDTDLDGDGYLVGSRVKF